MTDPEFHGRWRVASDLEEFRGVLVKAVAQFEKDAARLPKSLPRHPSTEESKEIIARYIPVQTKHREIRTVALA